MLKARWTIEWPIRGAEEVTYCLDAVSGARIDRQGASVRSEAEQGRVGKVEALDGVIADIANLRSDAGRRVERHKPVPASSSSGRQEKVAAGIECNITR